MRVRWGRREEGKNKKTRRRGSRKEEREKERDG